MFSSAVDPAHRHDPTAPPLHRARLFLRKRLEAHLSSAGIESTPSAA
jgi:hypothetical protein